MSQDKNQNVLPLINKERDLANHKFKGIVNAGEHVLQCSACGRDLIKVLVVRPKIPMTLNYRADCPFCGDHSWMVPITGGVVFVVTDHVINTTTDIEDDNVFIRTMKANVAP
jgi:hypothetical protein